MHVPTELLKHLKGQCPSIDLLTPSMEFTLFMVGRKIPLVIPKNGSNDPRGQFALYQVRLHQVGECRLQRLGLV